MFPVIKALDLEAAPPPVPLLNFAIHLVGAAALWGLYRSSSQQRHDRPRYFDTVAAQLVPSQNLFHEVRATYAAVELGALLCLSQVLMLAGLEGVSATSSAVLTESAVVLVPLMVQRPPERPLWVHWGPSAVALAGITLLVGGEPAAAEASAGLAGGAGGGMLPVVLSLLSAGCFAAHTVRTGAYTDVAPLEQAARQVVVAAALDAALLAGGAAQSTAWLGAASAAELQHLLLAAGWCGVVTCAFTAWAQAFAQREVAAPTAALAYAIEPCFAAAFAALFLHEQLGGTQAVGGALVVLANLIA